MRPKQLKKKNVWIYAKRQEEHADCKIREEHETKQVEKKFSTKQGNRKSVWLNARKQEESEAKCKETGKMCG